MSIPSFDFDDFVKGVANTIEQHLGADLQPPTSDPGPPTADHRPVSPDAFLLDQEKIVWYFPDTVSRIIEEPR